MMGKPIYFALFEFCVTLLVIANGVAGKTCVVCSYIEFNKITDIAKQVLMNRNNDKCKDLTPEDINLENPTAQESSKLENCPVHSNQYIDVSCGTLSGSVNVTLLGNESRVTIFHRGCLKVEKDSPKICAERINKEIDRRSNLAIIFSSIRTYTIRSFSVRRCICDEHICNEKSFARSMYASSSLLLFGFTISVLSQALIKDY
ncbi:uncharacterized protein LOC106873119 [Octopus bimaculoides]|uniref:Protein quiver n=1 Tax=Octopus bimaculoides TaxID=37653 RepID=A0A0L8H2U2_OCTBM|nr:uncharacterized protein LOC106873119 [Octopus bimaculoides]|eukprot:XP_014775833.1 PREDICTED: uncharacterized protein LOC106873119 [Octopus bimaculoides]